MVPSPKLCSGSNSMVAWPAIQSPSGAVKASCAEWMAASDTSLPTWLLAVGWRMR